MRSLKELGRVWDAFVEGAAHVEEAPQMWRVPQLWGRRKCGSAANVGAPQLWRAPRVWRPAAHASRGQCSGAAHLADKGVAVAVEEVVVMCGVEGGEPAILEATPLLRMKLPFRVVVVCGVEGGESAILGAITLLGGVRAMLKTSSILWASLPY
eukprot:2784675-Prymnesium_polylepis.1